MRNENAFLLRADRMTYQKAVATVEEHYLTCVVSLFVHKAFIEDKILPSIS